MASYFNSPPLNIIDYLVADLDSAPDQIVYVILNGDGEAGKSVTYAQLAAMVSALAGRLANKQLHGKRILLLYEDVLEFIVSFLVCQVLGIIAVPVPFVKGKKQIARINAIIQDAGASAVFCSSYAVDVLQQYLRNQQTNERAAIDIIATEPVQLSNRPLVEYFRPNEISFIQYTSGSTGKPKGVIISCSNLLHNQQLIKDTFQCNENCVIFSWLPYHHDMGLIGNILHTIYTACTCIIMSPYEFIQNPLKWLEAISKYRATHSGAPNFAYDLCTDKLNTAQLSTLDLSCWKVAYNGSEPIKAETMQRFAASFKAARFNPQAFYPCYGLAEATLLVSGIKQKSNPVRALLDKNTGAFVKLLQEEEQPAADEKVRVSSGQVPAGMDVKIISLHTEKLCNELEEGEICISGESVTGGYWNTDSQNDFCEVNGLRYFKTGDLGFLFNDELFVNGRRKEMLIIRGRNFYPSDIEETVASSHNAIRTSGVAVFEWHQQQNEWVVMVEIERTMLKDLDAAAVINTINNTIKGVYGLEPFDIVLTTPFSIPRTTSGKIKRLQCRENYKHREFNNIGSKQQLPKKVRGHTRNEQLIADMVSHPAYETIKKYLVDLIESKVETLSPDWSNDAMELTEIGLDSIKVMELMNTINKDLNINMDATRLFQDTTLRRLIEVLESMLWLKNGQTSDKGITI